MTESQDERLGLPSASNWRRYELCAGAFQLECEARRLGQLAHETSPQAQRGTRIHAYLGGTVDEDGKPIELSEEEQRTADFLQERSQDQVARLFGDAPWQQLDEKRLWFVRDGRKLASGKFDRCVYNDKLAVVQDFKSGHAEPVEAEISAQLKFLAVVVGLALPTVKEIVTQIVSVYFGVSERRFFIEDLAEAYRDVSKTLRAIEVPNAPLTPGVEQCRFCPAAMICQPCRDLLSPPTKFQTTTLPDDPDRAAKLLDEIAILEGVFEEVKKHYADRLTTDPAYRITNYAMVPGAVRREVTDWDLARQRLGEWLELDEINGAANYRLGDLEKALGKKLGLRGRELKERMNTILQGLVEERQNGASLKRIKGAAKVVTLAP
jgi:hypothetical protein